MDRRAAIEWLCDCLSMEPGATTSGKLVRLSASDWDDVIRLSVRHKVTPLLYQRSKRLEADAHIPAGVLQRLQKINFHSAARNTRLYHELGKVLAAFRDDGIPVIVLKGAHLAEIVYGNIALRPMGDVDILVKRTDLLRAGEKLIEMGYTCRRLWRKVADAASHHLPPFTKPNTTSIEIHWLIIDQVGPARRIMRPFHIDMDELWKSAQPAAIAGVQTLVLSPKDLLLHLCIHTSHQHTFHMGLRAFCDISETIRHHETEIDWKQVQIRARQWGTSNCVYLTLRLARELLKVSIPDEMLESLQASNFDPQFVSWAKEQIFSGPNEQDDNLPDIHNLAQVRENRRLWDKIATFLKTVFPSPKVMADIYPVSSDSGWVYATYLVRIKDLMLKYGRVTWRMWRGNAAVVAAAEQAGRANTWLEWLTAE
jgi:putative nucleotidyltransferase-like protein